MSKESEDFDRRAGTMIRELRRAKNWSQEKLGDEVGLSFQQIQKYEAGTNRMSVFYFTAFCVALEASPSRCIRELVEGGT